MISLKRIRFSRDVFVILKVRIIGSGTFPRFVFEEETFDKTIDFMFSKNDYGKWQVKSR